MTVFHLVRHGTYALVGQGLGGREGHSLSTEGRDQAARIASAPALRHVAIVLSSPVQRATETAALIAARLQLDVEIDAAFAEIDYAGWTGQRFADLRDDPAWQTWNRFRSTAAVPGGESMLAVQARAIGRLIHHATCRPAQELVVVSHADVIKAVLAHFLGMPLDLMHRLEIDPGSISRLALSQDNATVLAVNT